jgi:hypothetical protein
VTGRTEGMRPLGKFRSRWGYNIKMDLREIPFSSSEQALEHKQKMIVNITGQYFIFSLQTHKLKL